MELNLEHRNALLAELEKVQEDRDLQKRCLDEAIRKEDTSGIPWFEIGHFLALTRIEVIKQSISKNDIDY